MLYLPTPTISALDQYYDSVRNNITSALSRSAIPQTVKDFLDINKIRSIITDTPDKLLQHHRDVMNLLIQNFRENEFDAYLKIKRKKKRSKAEMIIFTKYSPTDDLSTIFNYKVFISGKKSTSYQFALSLDRNTCTYCNRLYTQTIIVKDKKPHTITKSDMVTRAEFDHWYPKIKFPVLAISFYNLIPCCGVCNSSIKLDTVFTLADNVHPYIKEQSEEFSFSYKHRSVNEKKVIVKMTPNSKISNTINAFRIKDVYDAHSNLELKDLVDLRYKYSDNYLDVLLNKTFKSLEVGKDEAYRMVFGVEPNEKDFHKRPFSKFKKEILKELGIKF